MHYAPACLAQDKKKKNARSILDKKKGEKDGSSVHLKKKTIKRYDKHVIKGFDPRWERDAARPCGTTISSTCQQRFLRAKCRNSGVLHLKVTVAGRGIKHPPSTTIPTPSPRPAGPNGIAGPPPQRPGALNKLAARVSSLLHHA